MERQIRFHRLPLEKAIEINPRLARAYYGRGETWMAKNDPDRAIRDFSRAIEMEPKTAAAYGSRGLALLRLGRDPEAEKDFAQCLRLDPTLRGALDQLILAAKAGRVSSKNTDQKVPER